MSRERARSRSRKLPVTTHNRPQHLQLTLTLGQNVGRTTRIPTLQAKGIFSTRNTSGNEQIFSFHRPRWRGDNAWTVFPPELSYPGEARLFTDSNCSKSPRKSQPWRKTLTRPFSFVLPRNASRHFYLSSFPTFPYRNYKKYILIIKRIGDIFTRIVNKYTAMGLYDDALDSKSGWS